MEHVLIKAKSADREDLVLLVNRAIAAGLNDIQHVQIDDGENGSSCFIVLDCDTETIASNTIKSLFELHSAVITEIDRRKPNADSKPASQPKFPKRGDCSHF